MLHDSVVKKQIMTVFKGKFFQVSPSNFWLPYIVAAIIKTESQVPEVKQIAEVSHLWDL